jgi:hypothetical protein
MEETRELFLFRDERSLLTKVNSILLVPPL